MLGSSSVTCRVAAAAMAMVTARTEERYHVVGFSTTLVPIKIHTKMRLDEVCTTMSQVSWQNVQEIQKVKFYLYLPQTIPKPKG